MGVLAAVGSLLYALLRIAMYLVRIGVRNPRAVLAVAAVELVRNYGAVVGTLMLRQIVTVLDTMSEATSAELDKFMAALETANPFTEEAWQPTSKFWEEARAAAAEAAKQAEEAKRAYLMSVKPQVAAAMEAEADAIALNVRAQTELITGVVPSSALPASIDMSAARDDLMELIEDYYENPFMMQQVNPGGYLYVQNILKEGG